MEGSSTLAGQQITALLKRLIDVPASHDPDTLLELVLIEALPADENTPSKPTPEKPEPKQQAVKPAAAKAKASAETPKETKTAEAEPVAETIELTEKEMLLDESTWHEALSILKKKHNTLYGIARMASPTFSDDTVTLTFSFPFHQKRLDDAKNKAILAQILSDLLGSPISIVCLVDAGAKKPEKAKKPDTLENISNIFGSAEVLE